MKTYQSFSSRETKNLGSELAKRIFNFQFSISKLRGALVFALAGDLGSGKTTFIQGFLRGLGIRKKTTSPTFIIMRRFKIENCKLKIENLHHVDAYRIKKPCELPALGLKEIFADSKNIVLIEWADNIKRILPENSTWIYFSHGAKENERTIRF